jgi:hypothetical protein
MMRVPMWATAFVLVAGASLAAPSLDVPMRAPQPERPTLSEDWSLDAFGQPVHEEMAAEGFQIAGKRRGGGGKRGGAKRKSRGSFRAGNKRNALRGGEPGRPGRAGRPGRIGDPGGLRGGEVGRPGRIGDPGGIRGGDVDIRGRDIDIDGGDIDIDYDDDDDELGAALMGGVIGLGIGSLLNDSEY